MSKFGPLFSYHLFVQAVDLCLSGISLYIVLECT